MGMAETSCLEPVLGGAKGKGVPEKMEPFKAFEKCSSSHQQSTFCLLVTQVFRTTMSKKDLRQKSCQKSMPVP